MAGRSTNTILIAQLIPRVELTDIALVLAALDGLHERYNWLFSGGDARIDSDHRPRLLRGNVLNEWTKSRGGGVYCGVLSAFDPGESVDPMAHPMPHADLNWRLWRPYPKPQHPRAVAELDFIGPSAILMLSREPEFTRRLRAHVPQALDHDEYIDRHVTPWLSSWADVGRRVSVGSEVTATVVNAQQTEATVEIARHVSAGLAVKQMRAVGFGPKHWFALCDELPVGQRVTVRVTALDVARRLLKVEFVRVGPADGDDRQWVPAPSYFSSPGWVAQGQLRHFPTPEDL